LAVLAALLISIDPPHDDRRCGGVHFRRTVPTSFPDRCGGEGLRDDRCDVESGNRSGLMYTSAAASAVLAARENENL
jgi:hypothetical protein